MEKPIFLCGHRKSGTTLLLSLLDSHPQLLVYPADSGFFYAVYPLCQEENWPMEKKIEAVINHCINNLKKEITRLSLINGKTINFSIKNFKNDFQKIAQETPGLTPAQILQALIRAFWQNTPQKKSGLLYWLEKTTSTEIYAQEIAQWFPQAKFIHLIRDPRDNWASLKSGWQERYQFFNDGPQRLLQSMIERGKLGMEFALNNPKIVGKEKYLVIRFEDLTAQPKKTMETICSFLGINFSETMLQPTTLEKLWPGNNFDGLNFQGPSTANVGRWPERTEPKEIHLIEYYFNELMEKFNYPLTSSLKERTQAVRKHYKWHNFAQQYSFQSTKQIK